MTGLMLFLDGHRWEYLGLEDTSAWRPQDRVYARMVHRCTRCGAEARTLGAPPVVWDIAEDTSGRNYHVPRPCLVAS